MTPTNMIVIVHFRGCNADVAHVRHVWANALGDYYILSERFSHYIRLMASDDIAHYENY